MLYNFQHSLTQTKVCFSLASKILLEVQQVSELLNVMTSPWSVGGGSEGISLKRYSALVFGCSRQRSCQNPGILRVQGWPCCLILGLSYSLQFILHSHGLLPHHRLKIISVSPSHTHTQSTSYLFEESVMTAFLTFALISIFLHETNHCVYTVTAPNCSRAYSPV